MRRFLLLFSFVLFYLPNMSYSQWVSTNSPGDGVVQSLVQNGANLIAGTVAGAYISANNGANWSAINSGLTNNNVKSLTVFSSALYAGTIGSGVFKSTNNGTNWTAANSGISTSTIQALAGISTTNLFAGTINAGVYLSTDNGTSWNAANTGITTANIQALAVIGTNLFAGTSTGAYLSTNNGITWTAINSGLSTHTNIKCLAVSGTNLLAGTGDAGVYISANNGTTWTAANTSITTANVQALALVGANSLLAGTSANGIWYSTNNGTSWTAKNASVMTVTTNVFSVALSGTNWVAGVIPGSNGGVYRSTNTGTAWVASNTGLTYDNIWNLLVSGSNLFAGSQVNGVYLSTDNGVHWASVSTGISNKAIWGLTSVGGYLIAGTNGNKLCFRSSDNGTTWTVDSVGLGNTACRALCSDGTNLYYGLFNLGVYKSTDNGATWAASNTGLTNLNVRGLFFDGTNIYCGTSNGGVFVSANSGASWSAINTGLTITQQFLSFARLGSWLFAGSGGNKAYRSSDNGASWTQMAALPTTVSYIATDGANIFASSNGSGVYESTDNGGTWATLNDGLVTSNNNVQVIAINSSYLFIGTQFNQVWKRPWVSVLPVELSTFTPAVNGRVINLKWTTRTEKNSNKFEIERSFLIGNSNPAWTNIGSVKAADLSNSLKQYSFTDKNLQSGKYQYRLKMIDNDGTFKYSIVVEAEITLPKNFELGQNYPNPFNPATRISYSLPADSRVTLEVYNITGERIGQIVNEEQPAGYYTVDFGTSSLHKNISSGVYLYRISAVDKVSGYNFTFVKKMVVLK